MSGAACYSPTSFKLAWKTDTLSTFYICYDFTLIGIDNHHLFLQHHAAIIVPVPGDEGSLDSSSTSN